MAIFCTCMHVDCTKTQHTHSLASIVFIHFTNDNVNNLSLNEKKIQWKWLDSMNQKRQRHATIIILFRIIARICVFFSLIILRSGYTHKLKIVVHIAQCPPPPLPPLLITLLKYFHQELYLIIRHYTVLPPYLPYYASPVCLHSQLVLSFIAIKMRICFYVNVYISEWYQQ